MTSDPSMSDHQSAPPMESCVKKIRYPTREAAAKARSAIEARKPDRTLKIYSCALCKGYHLSTARDLRCAKKRGDGTARMKLKSHGAAIRAAQNMKERFPDNQFTVYHCDKCDHWHVGNLTLHKERRMTDHPRRIARKESA